MKTAILTAAALLAGLGSMRAQESREAWLEKAVWITDYEKAREKSKEGEKLIFAFLTRSWGGICPRCSALKDGALMKDEFAAFARNYVLYFHVVSDRTGARPDDLLSEIGLWWWSRRCPYLVAMDSDGKVLAEHKGPMDAGDFEEMMARAREYVEVRKRAAAGDKEAKFRVLVHRLKILSISAEEAGKAAKDAGPLSKEQEGTLQGLLANASVMDVLKAMPRTDDQVRKRDSWLEAAKKLMEMKKAGKPTPADDMVHQHYWSAIMAYAEDQKDIAAYEEAMNALKETEDFLRQPDARQYLFVWERTLKRLKEGK